MRTTGAALLVLLTMGVSSALAQRRGFGGYGGRNRRDAIQPNPPYDGRFAFVRLRYGPPVSYASQRVYWSHDYPTGERNFMQIMNELTYLGPHIEETNVTSFGDPELFWRLCDANNVMNPLELTPEQGRSLRVPLPQP